MAKRPGPSPPSLPLNPTSAHNTIALVAERAYPHTLLNQGANISNVLNLLKKLLRLTQTRMRVDESWQSPTVTEDI